MKSLRLVFLGCGRATAMHSRTLRRHFPEVRRHYASRDPERARSHAARHGGEHFESYEAALADPGIDVAFVATPPVTHLSLALAALAGGKHVIVEKPPFLSTRELDTAAGAARREGRQLLVAENYAYKPLAGALRRIVESRVLGDVLFLHVNAQKSQRTGDWRDDPTLAGGGAWFEGGIHWVSLLADIGLTPSRASAVAVGPGSVARGRSALVVLEYREGAVATLAYSWDAPSSLRGARISRIWGTLGSAAFESNGLFLACSRGPGLIFPGLRDIVGYRAMFADFLAALRTGREPAYSLERARRDLELMDQMRSGASASTLPRSVSDPYLSVTQGE